MNGVLVTAAANAADTPSWLVCLIGIGTVFVGLMALILLCTVMGAIFRKVGSKKASSAPAASAPAASATEEIPNRQEVVAAIAAALAEEMGTDVAGLRILSIRRM